jgi:hypothetical protein
MLPLVGPFGGVDAGLWGISSATALHEVESIFGAVLAAAVAVLWPLAAREGARREEEQHSLGSNN